MHNRTTSYPRLSSLIAWALTVAAGTRLAPQADANIRVSLTLTASPLVFAPSPPLSIMSLTVGAAGFTDDLADYIGAFFAGC